MLSRSLAVSLFVCVAACDLPPKVPERLPLIPKELQHRELKPQADTNYKYFFAYDTNIVLTNGGSTDASIRLYPLDGRVEGPAFRATRFALGKLYDPGYKRAYWSVAAECQGTLVLDTEGGRVDVDGPGECKKVHAAFLAPKPAAPTRAGTQPVATGACQRYRDCVCALADRALLAKGTRLGTLADALAKNCTEAETLLRTAADDPASCNTGRTLTTRLVRELSASLPKACE